MLYLPVVEIDEVEQFILTRLQIRLRIVKVEKRFFRVHFAELRLNLIEEIRDARVIGEQETGNLVFALDVWRRIANGCSQSSARPRWITNK
jgi:hypothetical protein